MEWTATSEDRLQREPGPRVSPCTVILRELVGRRPRGVASIRTVCSADGPGVLNPVSTVVSHPPQSATQALGRQRRWRDADQNIGIAAI